MTPKDPFDAVFEVKDFKIEDETIPEVQKLQIGQ
jgi:hypothetical protein